MDLLYVRARRFGPLALGPAFIDETQCLRVFECRAVKITIERFCDALLQRAHTTAARNAIQIELGDAK